MTPLPVYVIKRSQVEALTSRPPIPQGDLDNYLSVRPRILEDGYCDIFQPNCRSETQASTSFDLFKIVNNVESGTVVVFPFWLELFEGHNRNHIATCIDWLKASYPGNPVVVQWNHDRNSATVPELQDLPSNFFCLQFNTSRPSPTDILLPAWAIETRQQWNPNADRPLQGGFIGHVGGVKVRQAMKAAFLDRSGWRMMDTTELSIPHDHYLTFMQGFDFALCPRGGGLNSYRMWEAIQCGCIPILFADDVALPYPNLNWDKLIVRIPEKFAGDFRFVTEFLVGIDVKNNRQRIAEVRQLFGLGGVQAAIHQRITEYLQ